MSMKNSNDTSWDRTSDLPICSTALKPLCHRGPQCNTVAYNNFSSQAFMGAGGGGGGGGFGG